MFPCRLPTVWPSALFLPLSTLCETGLGVCGCVATSWWTIPVGTSSTAWCSVSEVCLYMRLVVIQVENVCDTALFVILSMLVCVFACVFVSTYMCANTNVCVCIRVCLCVCIYACTCASTYVHTCKCQCYYPLCMQVFSPGKPHIWHSAQWYLDSPRNRWAEDVACFAVVMLVVQDTAFTQECVHALVWQEAHILIIIWLTPTLFKSLVS